MCASSIQAALRAGCRDNFRRLRVYADYGDTRAAGPMHLYLYVVQWAPKIVATPSLGQIRGRTSFDTVYF